MIRIYGYDRSSNVQKVAWACDELGLPFELDLTGGTQPRSSKDPDYLLINPNGQIPTLQDGEFFLWESNSIMRYLDEKYGGGVLMPTTPEGRAIANKWMDWQLATLYAPMYELFVAAVRTPPDERDVAAIAAAGDKAATMWKRVEASFGLGPYLAGEFSLGDIPLGIAVNRWYGIPVAKPSLPKVEAWFERLKSRKPFQDRVMAIPQPGLAPKRG
ncbi:MAG TPA: glutathione S-transferase family protein [Alphaproteobacteria bacterium]|jgi:glutathione S-transferase